MKSTKKSFLTLLLLATFSFTYAQLSVSVSSTDVLCNGGCDGSASATVSGGTSPYTYLWAPGGATTSSITNLCAGSYYVTVTDFNSSTVTDNVLIYEPNLLSATVTATDASCYGACDGEVGAAVSGGTGPYSYYWEDAYSINICNTVVCGPGLCAGTYFLTITDANGCQFVDSVAVSAPSAISTSITGTDVSCNGTCDGSADLTVSGGTSPYTYTWSNGSNAEDPWGLCYGIHNVTVYDANLCSSTAVVTISEPSQLNASITGTDASCSGTCDGTADLTVSGGTSPYTYSWSNGAAVEDLVTLCAGPFEVTVTDNNGCVTTASVTISEPAQLTANASIMQPSCGQCDGQLSASGTGGTSSYSYAWSPSTNLSNPNISDPNVCDGGSNLTYTVSVTDINGCIATAQVDMFTGLCDSVWPGDVNYDGIANNQDVLALGLAYGTTGPVRPGATINWVGQIAPNWTDTITGGVNIKHSDCNGDGVVDDSDTLAINNNYGSTHAKMAKDLKSRAGDPLLYFNINADTLSADTVVIVEIMLGIASNPADSIYGIAFTVNYDPALLKPTGPSFNIANSWLSGTSSLISVNHDFYSSGKFEAGISRTDQINTSGFGKIATIKLDITDSMPATLQTLKLEFSDIKAIDAYGNPITLNAESDSLVIADKQTAIEQRKTNFPDFKVYPNPARNNITIKVQGEGVIKKVVIRNILGAPVQESSILDQRTIVIDTHELDAGCYFMQVETDQGAEVRKVTIVR